MSTPTQSNTVDSRTLASWMEECHAIAVSKGWWEADGERNFGELMALAHSELSEAFEEYRKFGVDPERFIYYPPSYNDGPIKSCPKPEGIAVELADLLIRIFDNCYKLGIPLEEAMRLKCEFNRTREYRHGGKLC